MEIPKCHHRLSFCFTGPIITKIMLCEKDTVYINIHKKLIHKVLVKAIYMLNWPIKCLYGKTVFGRACD